MQLLWTLMVGLYGTRWTSQHGEGVDPSNIWAAALKGVTEEQIKHGAGECVKRGLDWPPSAPEFRSMATGADQTTWQHRQIAQADRDYRQQQAEHRAALPPPERQREAAKAAVAKMRELLR